MKQILISRLEQILVAVGGVVPAPLAPSNFYARSLQLAELILVQLGGVVPVATLPDNYRSRLLRLLEACLVAEGQSPISQTLPVGAFSDRLLALLGQLLTVGGGSLPALAAPTNRDARLLQLMDALLLVAPNFLGFIFQAETVAYENRVIALGSTLPSAAKTAIDAFFVAIKGQTYYSKIRMLWLGCGPSSLAGLATHLIHVDNAHAVMTAFAPEHYTPSGAGAGLQGGTGRRVAHSLVPNQLGVNDVSAFCFTSTLTPNNRAAFSVGGLTLNDLLAIYPNFSTTVYWSAYSDGSGFISVPAATMYGAESSGFLMGTRLGTSGAFYFNGALFLARAMTSGVQPEGTNTHSFYVPYSDPQTFPGKIQLSGCGLSFTQLEVAHFSTQVLALVAALRA